MNEKGMAIHRIIVGFSPPNSGLGPLWMFNGKGPKNKMLISHGLVFLLGIFAFAVRRADHAASPTPRAIEQSRINGHIDIIQKEPQILLVPEDFPPNFIHCRNPDDYKIEEAPITPECIYHKFQTNRRLFLRVSFKCECGYIPITFLLDTGSPRHFYLSKEAMQVLTHHSIIKQSETRLGNPEMYARLRYHDDEDDSIKHFMAQVRETPLTYEPANIAGLSALSQLGMCVYKEKVSFKSKITWL
jgi:hypothetical protein